MISRSSRSRASIARRFLPLLEGVVGLALLLAVAPLRGALLLEFRPQRLWMARLLLNGCVERAAIPREKFLEFGPDRANEGKDVAALLLSFVVGLVEPLP